MAVHPATRKSPECERQSAGSIIPDLAIIIKGVYLVGTKDSGMTGIARFFTAPRSEQQDGDTKM
jgi:hypothetical protein